MLTYLLLLPCALLALASSASACGLPPGGCTAAKCDYLSKNGWGSKYYALTNDKGDPILAYFAGIKNLNAINNSSRGGAYINFEVFPAIETTYLISANLVTDLTACCHLCASTPGCRVYQYFQSNTLSANFDIYGKTPAQGGLATKWPDNHQDGKNCYLLTGGSVDEGVYVDATNIKITSPATPTHTAQIGSTYRVYAPSWVGGFCNSSANVTDDPHFVGAHGTRFDFNGEVGKTFTLISDEKLHINIKLGGYEDSRTYGASVLKNGKAIRTWIKEVGVLWAEQDGSKHSLLLKARGGKEQAIMGGFISHMAIDGETVQAPALGSEVASGALRFKHFGTHKKGPYDVDDYHLSVDGLLNVRMEMRPAHPLLQLTDDAQIHFNIHIEQLQATKNIHGVLGQTYRESTKQYARAVEYQLLGHLMGGPVAADSKSGHGFLDGEPEDYETPSILSTASRYSVFT